MRKLYLSVFVVGFVWACGSKDNGGGDTSNLDSGVEHHDAAHSDDAANQEPDDGGDKSGDDGCYARSWDYSDPAPREAGCREGRRIDGDLELHCVCDMSACPLDLDPNATLIECAAAVTADSCVDGLMQHCGLNHIGDNGFCEDTEGTCWTKEDGSHVCKCTGEEPVETAEHDCYKAVLAVCPPGGASDDDAG